MGEQAQAFEIGAFAFQLQTALSFPQNYRGDPLQLHESLSMRLDAMKVKCRPLSEFKINPAAVVEKLLSSLAAQHPQLADHFRLGRLGTGLSVIGFGTRTQQLQDVVAAMEGELMQLAARNGVPTNVMGDWIHKCQYEPDRAAVQKGLEEIAERMTEYKRSARKWHQRPEVRIGAVIALVVIVAAIWWLCS